MMKDNKSTIKNPMSRGDSFEHKKGAVKEKNSKDGDIMALAKKDVISIPPTMSIQKASELMIAHGFRRLPITDPGSGKILGIVTAMDILDFLGGGSKFNIIEKKHNDNFLAAINDPIRSIMTSDVVTMSHKDSVTEAVKVMLDHKIGSIPVLDDEEKIVGIITERDFALSMAGLLTDEIVQDVMITDVLTTTPGTPIESSTKIMVRNNLRRIPVVSGDKLVGIITSTDILKFLGDKEMFSNMTSNSGLDVLNMKISEIMQPNISIIEPLTRLGDLCDLFKEKNIGGAPVVKDDKLVGIITERDILNTILKD
ncbi:MULTISPECIES: CBS domain-containing protein [unclassified Methanobrevibacter]|uniref:CBS domain-containing protein n=1 Tax=unclassified Methanobrevibacter TaxID=2638681 RepID=UPI002A115673|nr:CBS domain-containing protein [Methanobacteriaceae archaeon]